MLALVLSLWCSLLGGEWGTILMSLISFLTFSVSLIARGRLKPLILKLRVKCSTTVLPVHTQSGNILQHSKFLSIVKKNKRTMGGVRRMIIENLINFWADLLKLFWADLLKLFGQNFGVNCAEL